MKKATRLRHMTIVVLLGLISAQVQAVPVTQQVQEKERPILFPSTRMINQGRDVAQSTCADCHAMDGISDSEGKPHLAGQRAVYLYRTLQAYHSGDRDDKNGDHKYFLDDDALLAVAAYYANLAPAPVPQRPGQSGQAVESMPEEDPFLSIREDLDKCVKCHGETGNADGSGMPGLTAQDPEYFVASMMAYLDGSRSHNLMKRFAGRLDMATIRDMGVFYAVQEPVRTRTQGEGDVNVGRRLSLACEGCHGENGNTKKPDMPTLAGQDAKYFIKAMNQYKNGKRQHLKMFEAVEQLGEQEMADLATFYAAQEPLKRDVRTPLKSTEWIARCERCHGIEGNSSDPRFPMLAGQDESYLKESLRVSAAEGRKHQAMHAMANPLSSMDIERISAYFATRQPKGVVYIPVPCEDDQ